MATTVQCATQWKSHIQLIYLLTVWNLYQFFFSFVFYFLFFSSSSWCLVHAHESQLDTYALESVFFSDDLLCFIAFFLSSSIWWIFPNTIRSLFVPCWQHIVYLFNSHNKYLHFSNGVNAFNSLFFPSNQFVARFRICQSCWQSDTKKNRYLTSNWNIFLLATKTK